MYDLGLNNVDFLLYGLVFVQSNFNGTCSACLCVVSDCMNWLTQYISFNGELSLKKKKNHKLPGGQGSMTCSHPGTDPGTVCLISFGETPSRSGLYQEKEKKNYSQIT